MSYLGNQPVTGDNNSFKILDDITSYTLTFDGSSASVITVSDNSFTQYEHRFVQGQRVTYNVGGGTPIVGLSNGVYYIIVGDKNTFQLATSASNAAAGVPVPITGLGSGTTHTLNVAFDGVNTKFAATHDDGQRTRLIKATQAQININGVMQRPHNTATPTTGYGFESPGVIVFATPPTSQDIFWGNIIASSFPSFEVSDNKTDNFTGDGIAVSFTLSRTPVNVNDILVTIDGVVQYPNDTQVRAYSLSENVLSFSAAPPLNSDIQVRHIGFAGASTGNVTSFEGRSGRVVIIDSDPVVAIHSGGVGIGTVRTLNFIGAGNTFALNGNTIDISIAGGGGGGGGSGAGFSTSNAGLHTTSSIGVNTTGLSDALVGTGNSFQGMYISNGMMIMDNTLTGDHYIGTAFNGLMAGPVNITGVLTIDGNYVVV